MVLKMGRQDVGLGGMEAYIYLFVSSRSVVLSDLAAKLTGSI